MKQLNNLFLLLFYGCLAIACVEKEPVIQVIEIPMMDAIPEGIAVDPNGNIILSNVRAKNLVRASESGISVIQTPYTGSYSGVGVTIKEGKIYALANEESDTFRSVLQVIDMKSGKLEGYYQYSDTTNSFFNDLTISNEGTIYITNTFQNTVFRIKEDKLEPFLTSVEIEYPNGITLSGDGSILYVASYTKGIRSYDLNAGQFLNGADTTPITRGIDGLKWHLGSLIALRNGEMEPEKHALMRYQLTADGAKVESWDTLLIHHPAFNVPTTFDIVDGWVYCLANSQLDNLNQVNYTIKKPEALTNTFVIKLKL